MSMIEVHSASLTRRVSCYHEFLTRYSQTKKVVYGFVEGKDDPCFYRGFIENQLPDEWDLELWSAGSKNEVYLTHRDFDWSRFPKQRVCFFVDRDLSTMIPETNMNDINIYVTDSYSIENELVKRGTCRRILTEVCGFGNVSKADMDGICDLFEQEYEKYLLELVPIMAYILSWRRLCKNANLNDIEMKDIFVIKDGVLQVKPNPKGRSSIIDYIHHKCKLSIDTSISISEYELEFKKNQLYRKMTRGKYALWFIIQFCLSVNKSASMFITTGTKIPRMSVSMSPSNGVSIIGQRGRLPQSLKFFIQTTYLEYISHAAYPSHASIN